MICVSRQSLLFWLENEGGGQLLVEPGRDDLWGCRFFKRVSRHLSSVACHLKSQLPGQHLVPLHQWIKTCLFRVNGLSFKEDNLTAVLDRLAIGARVSLRLVNADKCKLGCIGDKVNSVHLKCTFITSWAYYNPTSKPCIYVSITGTAKSFHVLRPAEFLERFNVVHSDLHSWECPERFQARLELMYPQLKFEDQPLMEIVRTRAFESNRDFRLQFFFTLEYVSAQSLREFTGLLCAGAWGGASIQSCRGVLVQMGPSGPQFLYLSESAIELSKFKRSAGAQLHIPPENFCTGRGRRPAGEDAGSPSTCPCESGDILFRNLPPKQLARPVGQDEAPADIISNLRLLGLWTQDVERDLDLCTRLSCVFFDVER
jgi:hypothetical protein